VSVTWYTWLEQGRGGPPSDEVLERLARALELDAAAREVLFLLAQQRPRRRSSRLPLLRSRPPCSACWTPLAGPLTLEYFDLFRRWRRRAEHDRFHAGFTGRRSGDSLASHG
jgi:transcriptional regulator with XRE-family HTH domain